MMMGRRNVTRLSLISPFFTILALISFALLAIPGHVAAQKLNTSSRWIVDESGKRVKLACVNWASHLEPVLAEGLHKQPVDAISASIKSMGFNCVRFSWPLYLATDDTLAARTVRQTFQHLGLKEAIKGIESNNPSIIDLPTIEAYKMVLTSLRNNSVMVILDNQISTPGLCCIYDDGNGFFGDDYFNPNLWIKGLHNMATLATGFDNVVGMSLRNELRGPRQNVDIWYKYMQQGAETVHAANPNVLVILSGLYNDRDLSFLQNRQVNVSFTNKIVFEQHWYSFSGSYFQWVDGNMNEVCARSSKRVKKTMRFLRNQGFPLFLSEVGVDQTGTDDNDARFWNCFLNVAASMDLDFALWTLQGSYYVKQGIADSEEFYGMLDSNWTGVRNSTFLQRISAIQRPFRGPGLEETSWHKIIYHQLTGMCVTKASGNTSLKLGPCEQSEAWIYTRWNTLMLMNEKRRNSLRYLVADRPGTQANIGREVVTWDLISVSKMHIALKNEGNNTACLDVNAQKELIVNECKCLSEDNTCDPSSQWFRLVDSTRL